MSLHETNAGPLADMIAKQSAVVGEVIHAEHSALAWKLCCPVEDLATSSFHRLEFTLLGSTWAQIVIDRELLEKATVVGRHADTGISGLTAEVSVEQYVCLHQAVI